MGLDVDYNKYRATSSTQALHETAYVNLVHI